MKVSKRFQDYVTEKNFWAKVTGQYVIEFPLSQDDADKIGQSLSSDLSPENLHCDGERPYAQAVARGRKLHGVVKDLEKYCDAHNLHYPQLYY